MFRKILIFGLLTLFLTALYGCGGGGGGSDSPAPTSEVTVKTTIEMSGVSSAVVRAATDIIVTLTLPDGTEVRMTSTGNGNEYSCSVAYQEGDPVFIKAVYGDLVLKNFFESIDVSGATADLGATNPLTTLYVDVLESMVEAVDSTVTPSNIISYLLEGVKEATLAIDVISVKEEVTDTGNTQYATLQQAYTAAISWDSAGNAQAYEAAMNQVIAVVEAGGIEIPVTENEKAAIEAMANNIVSSFYSGNISVLTGMIYSQNFMDYGYNATDFIADMTAGEEEIPAGVTVSVVKAEALAVKMTSDDPAYNTLKEQGSLMYRILMNNHVRATLGGQVVYEEAYDDQKAGDAGMILQKINGTWYIRGNQERADFWATLNTDAGWSSRYAYISACEGTTDITSGTVTSNGFTGTAALAVNPYDTECKSVQVFENGEVWTWNGSQFTRTGTVSLNGGNLCGKTVTYSLAMADSSTVTKTMTLPSCVSKTVSISVVKNNDGSVTATYSAPNDEDISEVNLMVERSPQTSASEIILEKENLPFASTSYTFNASLFQSGGVYSFRLMYTDKYRRQYSPSAAQLTY
ncbi:hypothetical protein [Seleniivibrio woodruffii]|uniref:hypothetical protein n=1 Tax=Seleniivibrio woodruffii TaxID=1078050 RepID=UPI002409F47B|nr:hypothetical protein [Seleniivibrio woodruffii]